MTRGTIYPEEFAIGDVVQIGERSRLVKQTPDGVAFTASNLAPLPSIAPPLDAPPLRVTRQGDMLAREPWRYGLWSIVDVETTGIEGARIVEIGVVTMRFGCVVEAWSSLINPGMPIPADATAVHGITDAMVSDAPTMADVLPEVQRRIDASVATLGYNVFSYDEPILLAEGVRFTRPVIDVLPLVREHAVSVHTGLPASRWKSESEKRERDENDTGPAIWHWRKIGRHSLERAARETDNRDPETSMDASLHRAAWDCVLTGRVGWGLRGWLREDAATLGPRLRTLLDRQNASTQAFISKMQAEEAGRRKSPETRLHEAISELREALAMLDGFEQWKRGGKPTEAT